MGCTPGEQKDCSCSGGAKSIQVCTDDGTRFGGCECSDAGDSGTASCDPMTCHPPPHMIPICQDGVCQAIKCEDGYTDCDGDHATGCECPTSSAVCINRVCCFGGSC